MIRKIVQIDSKQCNGCGLCVTACHEGAIGMVEGKATLLRDDYCDGLGDCLPVCPTDAISFVEREATAYDQAAIFAHQAKTNGCPGIQAQPSQLSQWPVQIQLVPIRGPYFQGADLLIAADCTAYAYASFHETFIKGRVTLVGCPKLDAVPYAEKLSEIFKHNDIHTITLVRMEVPCCGGLESAAVTALAQSGKDIPLQVVTLSIDGQILK